MEKSLLNHDMSTVPRLALNELKTYHTAPLAMSNAGAHCESTVCSCVEMSISGNVAFVLAIQKFFIFLQVIRKKILSLFQQHEENLKDFWFNFYLYLWHCSVALRLDLQDVQSVLGTGMWRQMNWIYLFVYIYIYIYICLYTHIHVYAYIVL